MRVDLALKIIAWSVTCDVSSISLIYYKISMLTTSLSFFLIACDKPIKDPRRNAERGVNEKNKFAIVSTFPKYAQS